MNRCTGSGQPPEVITHESEQERWHAGGTVGRHPRGRCPACGREIAVYENRAGRTRDGHTGPRLADHAPTDSTRSRWPQASRCIRACEALVAAENVPPEIRRLARAALGEPIPEPSHDG